MLASIQAGGAGGVAPRLVAALNPLGVPPGPLFLLAWGSGIRGCDMATRPSFQFYPADWLTDRRLRRCSEAARGVWIDLICLMHDGTPYGHAATDGVPLSLHERAQATGIHWRTLRSCEGELRHHKVLQESEFGLYSRRMVKDEELRNKRAAGGKMGGNPNLIKQKKVNLKGWVEGYPARTPPSSSSSSSSSLRSEDLSETTSPQSVSGESRRCNGVRFDDIKEVLGYLNTEADHGYRHTKPNGKPSTHAEKIRAILKSGYTVADCKAVIDRKVAEWANDPAFAHYLSPDTLFRPSKFEKYLDGGE